MVPSKNEDGQKNREITAQKIPAQEKSGVYLEDVLFALKNQNWTKEEEPCLNKTLVLIQSLQNFTLWAVFNWDSISSQPLGLLYGNRYQLGNYDECLKTPWSDIHPEIKTQYCLSEVVLERSDSFVTKRNKSYDWKNHPYGSVLDYLKYRPAHMRPLNDLTWGVCVPAECGPLSVKRLLTTMLAHSYLGVAGIRPRITVDEPCQKLDNTWEYDALLITFISLLVLLIIISLVCTILSRRKEESSAFCLKKNASDLLKFKRGAEVLYGIRFLSICGIVLGHQIGMPNGGPTSNGVEVDRDVLSIGSMFIVHNDLFVDTYFFLSGFLLASSLIKYKKMPNVFILILRRYIRLSVGLAVVIFYYCAILWYTGSGPLWNRFALTERSLCRKNWWLNLLMIQNYVDSDNICIVTSWYIPCDFHFFVVTVLAYWLYKKSPRLGLVCAGVLTVASVVSAAVLNYIHELPPSQLFTYEFLSNPRGSKDFQLTYIKSHTRYAAYIVGFASGCIFVHYGSAGNLKKISQKWSVFGACTALLVMMLMMINGATFLWRDYDTIEGVMYAAFNRPIWACGIAVLVFCCSWGHVPLITDFLSWYPWVPLSRLTYGIYLTHTLFILRNVFVVRSPRHFDKLESLNDGAGNLFWSCVTAFIIWLLAEAPANNLFHLWITSTKTDASPKEGRETREDPNKKTTTSAISSSGHDNLPPIIYLSKI
ncbi:LOW QUALITY PROTEIN: nose resistant to fluoxetine protein 6-like [Aphomia sociella]